MKFKSEKLLFGLADNVSVAADVISEPFEVSYNYNWNIAPQVNEAITGTPTYSIEVSDNNVDWFKYDDLFNDLDINKAAEADGLSFKYIRVSLISNGATGNVTFILGLKAK